MKCELFLVEQEIEDKVLDIQKERKKSGIANIDANKFISFLFH